MTEDVFPVELAASVRKARIVAVVVIDSADDAVPLADALVAGGISAIELTLRTVGALDALKRIKAERPSIVAGVGTVLTPEQVGQVAEAGAAFAVAPGLNPEVVKAAKSAGLPFAPGITTPSDIEAALALGCRLLKFFPAEPSGGIPYLKSIAAPYAHLGVEYIPLGGLTGDNFASWLALDNVPAVGGSWIAPRNDIRQHDWDAITARAKAAFETLG